MDRAHFWGGLNPILHSGKSNSAIPGGLACEQRPLRHQGGGAAIIATKEATNSRQTAQSILHVHVQ